MPTKCKMLTASVVELASVDNDVIDCVSYRLRPTAIYPVSLSVHVSVHPSLPSLYQRFLSVITVSETQTKKVKVIS